MCYQALGDAGVLDAIVRGMNAFLVMQQGQPQPGWALQYTLDLKPAGARTYEPKALVTHTTAANVESLLRFYRLTGETKFLARIPEALDWLERIRLPEGVAPPGRTHATFIELGTDKPLYVHREGSNVVNGRYYVDHDPKNTIGHYSGFRRVDLARLRQLYEKAKGMSSSEAAKGSPLTPGAGTIPLPRFFTMTGGEGASQGANARQLLQGLTSDGYWLAPLGMTSHPYGGPGSATAAPGDFSRSHVGDTSDTSPFPDETIKGISTAAYIRNMGVLIRALESGR
jgi:hypothetical protein